ncbi:MAG: bifunctional phosphoribosylaminoimidazolecarboxamide formyltransferase/IMP cyclohydrolase [Planctomycetes bacterium]|nr:bifunctional phosphoribosylaminoimidazolecarboxamide formyltransferase/IMP cyclohydrolase [Planctomycetota bacterium]MCB9872420.1 bifunctional phosphoribosylaminoimidazolecarboxamide formyltransferase/IMP cyclohydrolase [Planctomycetota bacterium]MCB9888379.1 bifunctional phosphoribosylaminoimidazolecarboxamide formyltransferase/IMP cyclohydrolase [Planctomycetota bacterium]
MGEPATTRRRALISVTDKTGVGELARGLAELGFSLLSTGGTMREIRAAGVDAQEVADYTGSPEMMDGRLKTLHPRVHGGILARRDHADDLAAMAQHGIDEIDLVVVNLYAFRDTARRPGASPAEVVENIDIGGPTMIRSAAKNHRYVAVVVDPNDYPAVLAGLKANGGVLPEAQRRELAAKAFAHTASYDTAVAAWFADRQRHQSGAPRFGAQFGLVGERVQSLRYGENPGQHAAYYRDPDALLPSLAAARQLSGKELSYNNLLDLDAAMGVAFEFTEPSVAIVKHLNPCGTASGPDAAVAFRAALDADPVSAFGGIVGVNVEVTRALAEVMVAHAGFLEAIVAPAFAADAVPVLQAAKWGANVRLLELGGVPPRSERVLLRQIDGGFLLQTYQPGSLYQERQVVTRTQPSAAQLAQLDFAMRVCKHVKSNAIVLAAAPQAGVLASVGVGAGQMSRVDSVRIATEKAQERARGAVLASDAFFPFADGLELAAAAGVAAVIQPGGSKRDDEVIAAADAAGVVMVFTGTRHFRH